MERMHVMSHKESVDETSDSHSSGVSISSSKDETDSYLTGGRSDTRLCDMMKRKTSDLLEIGIQERFSSHGLLNGAVWATI